jgi:hypothetical protein
MKKQTIDEKSRRLEISATDKVEILIAFQINDILAIKLNYIVFFFYLFSLTKV